MEKLQQLISTTVDCSQLRSWEFFFQSTDESQDAQSAMYRLFLESLEKSQISSEILVFEEKVDGMSRLPLHKLVAVTVSEGEDGKLKSLGNEWHAILNYSVGESFAGVSGFVFRGELSVSSGGVIGAATHTGHIGVGAGRIAIMFRSEAGSLTDFETACIEQFPEACLCAPAHIDRARFAILFRLYSQVSG